MKSSGARVCALAHGFRPQRLAPQCWGGAGHGEERDRDPGSGDDEAEFAWLPVNALKTFGEGKRDGIAVNAAAKDPSLQVCGVQIY